jgi:hypothetical protein
MGSYNLDANNHADALEWYNLARKSNADHDGLPTPEPLTVLPRGTYRIKDGEERKRFLRFPQVWEYEIRGTYAGQECEVFTAATLQEAQKTLREYLENEKGIAFRIVKVKASN